MSSAPEKTPVPTFRPRIDSLDQFRGYTMAGMFLVNYMGGTDTFPSIMKHHHNFCSYSDTIMPHFLFAVGFAFRLTFGRRAHDQGLGAAYSRLVQRFLGLMLVAMIVYGADRFDTWSKLYNPDLGLGTNLWYILHPLIKREWMQTLGHIAVTSIWILPVIRAGALVRTLWMLLSMVAHVYLSGNAHIFDGYFETLSRMGGFLWVNEPPAGIDGGPFGFLTWTIPAIMGTLTCDAVVDIPGEPKLRKLLIWSIVLMGAAYVMSCGTRLYDVPAETTQAWLAERTALTELAAANEKEPDAAKKAATAAEIGERNRVLNSNKFPSDPVWPAKERWAGKGITNLLAEPPLFGRPPNPERDAALASVKGDDDLQTRRAKKNYPDDWYYRQWNYWMMSQRGGTVSYPLFAAGFSILVYLIFYIVCDKWGYSFFVFRTFGVNALLGYILQGLIGGSLTQAFLPGDPPAWYAWANFGVYFFLMWFVLRFFEKSKIFIRM
jgi:predicted acyltransferase